MINSTPENDKQRQKPTQRETIIFVLGKQQRKTKEIIPPKKTTNRSETTNGYDDDDEIDIQTTTRLNVYT